MSKILGLVNLHNAPDLGPIGKNRSIGSLNFLGRFAFVDLPLSNFSNSNINTMGILVSKAPRSMIKHMGNAMSYSSNTKLGKTIICYNEKYANNAFYNTDINNIIENSWLLEEDDYQYVIIAPTHIIYQMDFQEVLKSHQKSGAAITSCYKKVHHGKTEFVEHNIFLLNEDGTLSSISKNLGVNDEINLSLETYIINMDTLKDILSFASSTSKFFSLDDVLNYISSTMKIHTYEFMGEVASVTSAKDYLSLSLSLLDYRKLSSLWSKDWPIYTKTHDTPPTKYLEDAACTNSFISNGAIINGTINHSVICRDVKVARGAHIESSIISTNAEIGENVHLEYVIVDKKAKIINVKELKGTKDNPLYIGQGDII